MLSLKIISLTPRRCSLIQLSTLITLLLCSSLGDARSLYRYKAPPDIYEPDLPRVVLIIDDMGNSPELGQRAVQLPGNITYAFLPFTPAATSLAEAAHARGKEVMLHAPMSSLEHNRLGPGALTKEMDKHALQLMLRNSIKAIPHIKGINNHMGSELTPMSKPMRWVMEELRQHRLFFVDSKTNPRSIAYRSAQNAHIPSIQRDVFLDHDPSPAAIEAAFKQAVAIAHNKGIAVAIGHPYPTTLGYLEQALKNMKQWQVELVFVSDVVPRIHKQTALNSKRGLPAPSPLHQTN